MGCETRKTNTGRLAAAVANNNNDVATSVYQYDAISYLKTQHELPVVCLVRLLSSGTYTLSLTTVDGNTRLLPKIFRIMRFIMSYILILTRWKWIYTIWDWIWVETHCFCTENFKCKKLSHFKLWKLITVLLYNSLSLSFSLEH